MKKIYSVEIGFYNNNDEKQKVESYTYENKKQAQRVLDDLKELLKPRMYAYMLENNKVVNGFIYSYTRSIK